MEILHTNNITKDYSSNKALSNLSFELNKGDVLGLLGPNGSGKSTTLGIIMGVTKLSSGDFSWFGGEDIHVAKKRIGAMIEHPAFYPYLSAEQNLKVVCDIKEIRYSSVENVLRLVRLDTAGNKSFKQFSLGMKQRLALASALLGDPEVLVLDEPTNGLDPKGIVEIRDIILDLAKKGKTIIFASHILSEVQKICNRLLVLKDGIKVYDGSMDKMLGQDKQVEVSATNMDTLEACLKSYSGVSTYKVQEKFILISLNDFGNIEDFSNYLQEQKLALTHFNVHERSLEKEIINLLKKK